MLRVYGQNPQNPPYFFFTTKKLEVPWELQQSIENYFAGNFLVIP